MASSQRRQESQLDDLGRYAGPSTYILASLADGPKHGYALTKDIESFANVRLGPGTLYGALGRLEERGLVEALESEDRRRPYRLTADGATVLQRHLSAQAQVAKVGLARLRGSGRHGVEIGRRGGAGMTQMSGPMALPPVTDRIERRAARWLMAYPSSWRDRYGAEMTVLLADTMDGDGWGIGSRLDVLRSGFRTRLEDAGLRGGSGDPAQQIRGGALTVLCAFLGFVLAGASVQKFSEHWGDMFAPSARAAPTAFFDVLRVVGVVTGLFVIAGALPALLTLRRVALRDGWDRFVRPILVAAGSIVVCLGLTVGFIAWAHHVQVNKHLPGDGTSVVLALWVLLVVATFAVCGVCVVQVVQRMELGPKVLRAEGILAVAVALAMVVMLCAAAAWWFSMAPRSRAFLVGPPSGSPWDVDVVPMAAVMVVAAGVAAYGAVRAVGGVRGLGLQK